MFERFGSDARAAVIAAQEIARSTRSPALDGRHLLIALAVEDGPAARALAAVGIGPDELAGRLRGQLADEVGLDAAALASLGIDLDVVRRRADEVLRGRRIGSTGPSPTARPCAVTTDAKHALELGLREAVRLHAARIDGGHLLLGMLRVPESPAGRALTGALVRAGADADALRAAVQPAESAAS